MARIIDAFQQFFDGNGQPLAGGYFSFFENESAIALDTFNDPDQAELNPAKVPLDGEGRLSLNVYASVICTGKLYNSNDSLIETYDNLVPRGGLTTGNSFAYWNDIINYSATASIVTGSDGNIYQAKTDNLNVDPVVDFAGDGDNWAKKKLSDFWTTDATYAKNDKTISTIDNNEYTSVKGSNTGVEPSGDTTGTNWVLSVLATNWAIDREYAAGEQAISRIDYRRYRAQGTTTGDEPSVDDGTNWLPVDGVVVAPTNSSPADDATAVSRLPTLTSSAFSVNGATDTHEYSIYQISDDDFSTVLINSGVLNEDLESYTVTSILDGATEYSFRARYKGVKAGLSEWSTPTSFTTTFVLLGLYYSQEYIGTGAAKIIATAIDLVTEKGFGFIGITDGTSDARVYDTMRGIGNVSIVGKFGVACDQVNEPTGMTAFGDGTYTLGTDVNYNNSLDEYFSVTFGEKVGFSTSRQFTGTETITSYSHALGHEVGFMFSMFNTGSQANSNNGICWFKGFGPKNYSRVGHASGLSSIGAGGYWGNINPTDTEFTVGIFENNNATGALITQYLVAHNPAAGVYCGSYSSTGSPSNKVVTGFPVKTVITMWATAGETWLVFDKDYGVGSHLQWTGGTFTKTAGGLQSFDSDGFTLDSTPANSVGTYYFIAIADPNLF